MKTNKLRIWHISDTHGYHDQLVLPEDIDLIIHTGDCSNSKIPAINEGEVYRFIEWYSKLDCMKIYSPGNHDTSIEHRLVRPKDFTDRNIMYLENEDIIINGIKFTAIPYVPTFGVGWSFMKSREKLGKLWDTIPEDTNVLLTHGPPKGILDLSENRDHSLEQCGDGALYKRIQKLPNITHNLFGHLHSFKTCRNHGIYHHNGITYSNACVLEDSKFDEGVIFNGNIIEI